MLVQGEKKSMGGCRKRGANVILEVLVDSFFAAALLKVFFNFVREPELCCRDLVMFFEITLQNLKNQVKLNP